MQTSFDKKMLGRKRRSNGYKQVDVANTLGIGLRTIQRFEGEGVQPHLDAKGWVMLQEIYGMTIEQFAAIGSHQSSAA